MECIFHKWGKWSKPRKVEIKKTYTYYERREYSHPHIQDRTCEKCGKYQWEEV